MIIFLITLLLSVVLANHPAEDNNLNRFNEKGEKTGLWIEYPSKDRCVMVYYKQGLKHGLCRIYDNGYLSFMGDYCEGLNCGTWYFFNQEYLVGKIENIHKLGKDNNGDIWLVGYSIGYYESGQIEVTGELVWESEYAPESDFSIQTGEWIYYNEEGEVLRTEQFPDASTYISIPYQ